MSNVIATVAPWRHAAPEFVRVSGSLMVAAGVVGQPFGATDAPAAVTGRTNAGCTGVVMSDLRLTATHKYIANPGPPPRGRLR